MMGYSDFVDHSVETEDRLRDYEIQRVRRQAKVTLPYTGVCYFCESEVHSPKVFCDADCRTDFEHMQKMKRIAGK